MSLSHSVPWNRENMRPDPVPCTPLPNLSPPGGPAGSLAAVVKAVPGISGLVLQHTMSNCMQDAVNWHVARFNSRAAAAGEKVKLRGGRQEQDAVARSWLRQFDELCSLMGLTSNTATGKLERFELALSVVETLHASDPKLFAALCDKAMALHNKEAVDIPEDERHIRVGRELMRTNSLLLRTNPELMAALDAHTAGAGDPTAPAARTAQRIRIADCRCGYPPAAQFGCACPNPRSQSGKERLAQLLGHRPSGRPDANRVGAEQAGSICAARTRNGGNGASGQPRPGNGRQHNS
jgi:hypothetical protein